MALADTHCVSSTCLILSQCFNTSSKCHQTLVNVPSFFQPVTLITCAPGSFTACQVNQGELTVYNPVLVL